jgi:hypothetical protein
MADLFRIQYTVLVHWLIIRESNCIETFPFPIALHLTCRIETRYRQVHLLDGKERCNRQHLSWQLVSDRSWLRIIGIVTDGQQSIRLAMESLLPEVPNQYCQCNYLKDIAKPIVDLDRKLKTGIKKSLRGICDIERKVDKDVTLEAEIQSWNEYIVRSGEFVVFVDDALRQPDVLYRLQSVSYEVFHAEPQRWTKRLDETTKRRRYRRNTAKYLKEIENNIVC